MLQEVTRFRDLCPLPGFRHEQQQWVRKGLSSTGVAGYTAGANTATTRPTAATENGCNRAVAAGNAYVYGLRDVGACLTVVCLLLCSLLYDADERSLSTSSAGSCRWLLTLGFRWRCHRSHHSWWVGTPCQRTGHTLSPFTACQHVSMYALFKHKLGRWKHTV
jgi:hypothetical protein